MHFTIVSATSDDTATGGGSSPTVNLTCVCATESWAIRLPVSETLRSDTIEPTGKADGEAKKPILSSPRSSAFPPHLRQSEHKRWATKGRR